MIGTKMHMHNPTVTVLYLNFLVLRVGGFYGPIGSEKLCRCGFMVIGANRDNVMLLLISRSFRRIFFRFMKA